MSGPVIDLGFPHHWHAQILAGRPVILPARRYVYPREVEEIARGALEVLIRVVDESGHDLPGFPVTGPRRRGGFSRAENAAQEKIGSSAPAARLVTGLDFSRAEPEAIRDHGALAPEAASSPQPFLATCAVGFLDPIVPTGIWSCPNPREICAVSGGYAYLIDTTAPERFTMIAFRPVLEIRPVAESGLLLFVGHRSIIAWGRDGQAWQSEKLSDEGVTISAIESGVLRGLGWKMLTDKETTFALDLASGNQMR